MALVVNQLLGDLCMSPKARGVDQLPPATRAQVRVPVVMTSCHGRLGTLTESPWGQPAFPGYLGQCPRTHGVDQLSRATMERARGVAVSNSCPG